MKITSQPYQARPIRFLELWHYAGWRIKVYGIASGRTAPRDDTVLRRKGGADRDAYLDRQLNEDA
jgi:hypothetical protein